MSGPTARAPLEEWQVRVSTEHGDVETHIFYEERDALVWFDQQPEVTIDMYGRIRGLKTILKVIRHWESKAKPKGRDLE